MKVAQTKPKMAQTSTGDTKNFESKIEIERDWDIELSSASDRHF